MSFIYEKPDEKEGGKTRWFAGVMVGNRQIRVSLRLEAPGNKRLAKSRADQLQHEVLAGKLSESTREWLGKSASRLDEAMNAGMGLRFATWSNAVERFLVVNPGTGRAARWRRKLCEKFAEWADARQFPVFGSQSAVVGRWLASEVERGITPRTVRAAHVAYLRLLLNWLAAVGSGVERLAVAEVLSSVPRPKPVTLVLPSRKEDLAALRDLQALGGEAWGIYALVRGLGCRPSEAMVLDWSRVDLSPGFETVEFVDTKDQKTTGAAGRTCPILWSWLLEFFRARKQPSGLVCPSRDGGPWRDQARLCYHFSSQCGRAGLAVPKLKQAQKLGIIQMIQSGFPAHVVAFWTGHTLTVQEKHYTANLAYLPSPDDYGEFGQMTRHGQKALKMLGHK